MFSKMAKAELPGATPRHLPGPLNESPREERELATRFVAGERAAAEEVITRYAPRITRLMRRMLSWQTGVDDVVQDTFVAALASRQKFRGNSQLETWLVRIAVNRCRAFHRRRLLRSKLFAAWRDARTKDVDGGADASSLADEQAAAVRSAVAGLSPKYREVVVLFYLEDMTAQETADALSLKRNTVEVRLTRARKMLAEPLAVLMDTLP
jgi:RNA polymerase sigma-70 factor (ECF subfamily)